MAEKLVFDEEWVAEYCQKHGKPVPDMGNRTVPEQGKGLRRERPSTKPDLSGAKYGNRKTERNGKLFDSKHEADVYGEIALLAAGGEICGFSWQVPFYLPGGVKYIADFVTMNRDGSYTVIDAKSEATKKDKTYRLKRRLMKECLGIEIEER